MGKGYLAILGFFLVTLAGASYLFLRPGEEIIPPAIDRESSNSQMLTKSGEKEIISSQVQYYRSITGHYARPIEDGNYPGIVMVHEWWGLNDHIKEMADSLASEGYRVLAVDLYNGTIAQTPETAREQTVSLDQKEALANLEAATDFLRAAGAMRVASLGWCFGGGQALQLSLNTPLDATIIYYGQLETNSQRLASITTPVLGIFGSEDQSIPVDQVNLFRDALAKNNTPHQIHIYPGVGHAFANPSGANYAPTETQDAWEKTLTFLRENVSK